MAKIHSINEPTNGARDTLDASLPYAVAVTVTGSADLLFHRWNCEAVDAKSKAAKGSKGKKSDDVESYVWRNEAGELCLPGEYLRQSIIAAAKFKQDPRSPRKSAMDLFKAGVVSSTMLAPLGTKEWDYLDTRRVMVQRAGINRTRPAMRAGWKAEFILEILTPEYIDQALLHDVITTAGRLIGLGDFRPTFGRFGIVRFEIARDSDELQKAA